MDRILYLYSVCTGLERTQEGKLGYKLFPDLSKVKNAAELHGGILFG
ncbi:hypothetical protein [Sphingobacterium athyrii]|nr:hypothetical protein [Sphingobacterium athyrii]